MDRARYDQYLGHFNNRDYDKVLEFWAPKFTCMMGDKVLFGSPKELKAFYGFLHDYVEEMIFIDHFLSSAELLFMEARVMITGKKAMTTEIINASGFTTLTPINEGAIIEIPQLIHYHLRDGKFISAVCLISAPPIIRHA
jgi:hypothetical protein